MLILPAYAKLNLALEVLRRRDDGWHDIDTIVVPLDWHGLVGVTLRRSDAPACTLRVSGEHAAHVPADDRNLAARAATEMLAAVTPAQSADVWLDKRIPPLAGLGGGSADAATVIRGLTRLLGAGQASTEPAPAETVAARIGSDVPALLHGVAVRARGRGEVLSAIHVAPLHVVVAFVAPSATAATYAALRDDELHAEGRVERLQDALQKGDADGVDDSLLGSALEPAACRASPALAERLRAARDVTPGRSWHLTGSGGAIFSFARLAREAAEVAALMDDAGFRSRACRTLGVSGQQPL